MQIHTYTHPENTLAYLLADTLYQRFSFRKYIANPLGLFFSFLLEIYYSIEYVSNMIYFSLVEEAFTAETFILNNFLSLSLLSLFLLLYLYTTFVFYKDVLRFLVTEWQVRSSKRGTI